MDRHNGENFPITKSQDQETLDQTPFFSIGVTTYNRPELLKQTLLSITQQTFQDFEVIVGNDYVSEPLSAELLGIHDPRIRFENHPRNLGEAKNMNTLLDISHGRYFTWQCDDDLFAPNFLEEVFTTLTRFKFPSCVFTSYQLIRGTVFPDMAKTLSGQGKIFSGKKFFNLYWSGKLNAMGCTGAYRKKYLQELGGVKCFADIHHPLYSEHLLLAQVGLQEQIAHIDEPLVLYRIHEDAWGCGVNDLLFYQQAGEGLVCDCIPILKSHELQEDFRRNMGFILNFVVNDFFDKAKSLDGLFSRLKVIPFFFRLKTQFNILKGESFYRKALISWGVTGLKLVWRLGNRQKCLFQQFRPVIGCHTD